MKKSFVILLHVGFWLLYMHFSILLSAEPIKEYESMVTKAMGAVMIKKIHEEKFVRINGIDQWVTMHGDTSKPILLFLHGGPGSVLSPYSENIFKEWEKDFVIVQWDQRGAGRSFGKAAPEELTPVFLKNNPLTLDQMTADGIAVSEYLLKRLKKQKLILFGSSWGSVLGVTMASRRPDLFLAYIGHSQVTNPSSDLGSYQKVFQLAEQNKDTASLQVLRALGNPPYSEAGNVGKLFRVLKKYERMREEPAPGNWFKPAPGYDNEKDSRHRDDGDDYSFVNYTGDQKMGIAAMRNSINFPQSNTEFKIPVYLIQGEKDLLTRKEDTEQYFRVIKAPDKKYYLLPNAAHGFNQPVLSTLYTIVTGIWR